MERQLRDLLNAEAGDPPHRITVEAVRRRVVRRRAWEGITAAVAVVAVTAIGVTITSPARPYVRFTPSGY